MYSAMPLTFPQNPSSNGIPEARLARDPRFVHHAHLWTTEMERFDVETARKYASLP